MKRAILLIVISSLALPLAAANPLRDDAEKIPKTMIDANGRGWAPFWVDARLFDEQGQYTGTAALANETKSAIPRLASMMQENGCVHIREASIDYLGAPTHRDLSTAIREAEFIVQGTITSRTYGLFDGNIPGQMLSLTVEKQLKGYSPLKTYFFYVPVGTFRLGPVQICKTDSRYPAVPQPGDRVVVFGHERFRSDGFLNTFDEGGFLTIKPTGDLVLPRRYRADSREHFTESHFATIVTGANAKE